MEASWRIELLGGLRAIRGEAAEVEVVDLDLVSASRREAGPRGIGRHPGVSARTPSLT